MVMHYPGPAEVRRGGWLTHAEGGIKAKSVPVGPRPESLKRILEGTEGESHPCPVRVTILTTLAR